MHTPPSIPTPPPFYSGLQSTVPIIYLTHSYCSQPFVLEFPSFIIEKLEDAKETENLEETKAVWTRLIKKLYDYLEKREAKEEVVKKKRKCCNVM